jgi:hypothetical protein
MATIAAYTMKITIEINGIVTSVKLFEVKAILCDFTSRQPIRIPEPGHTVAHDH